MKKEDIQLLASIAILGVAVYMWYLTSGLSPTDVAKLGPALKKFNQWAEGLPS